MTEIVLTNDQVQQIEAAGSRAIALRAPDGTFVGFVDNTFTPEEIELAKSRIAEGRGGQTTGQVLKHLEALGRIQAKGQLSGDRLLELAKRARQLSADPTHDQASVEALAREFSVSLEDVRSLVIQSQQHG